MTKIAAIIIHYGDPALTRRSLLALSAKLAGHHLILINNTPADASALQAVIPGTRLIDNRQNLGFAKAVNQGISLALTDPTITHILLLNNDLTLTNGTLRELLVTFTRYPDTGLVAPLLKHSGGYDWGGKYNSWTGLVRHRNWENPPKTILSVEHVAGAAMLIPREVLDQVGLLDERFFLYYEDLDFCLRLKAAGYQCRINPLVVASHLTSASSRPLVRTLAQWRSHLLFVLKHFPSTCRPTALFTDLLYYPLILLKTGLLR